VDLAVPFEVFVTTFVTTRCEVEVFTVVVVNTRKPCGIWRSVFRRVVSNFSKDHGAFVFRVKTHENLYVMISSSSDTASYPRRPASSRLHRPMTADCFHICSSKAVTSFCVDCHSVQTGILSDRRLLPPFLLHSLKLSVIKEANTCLYLQTMTLPRWKRPWPRFDPNPVRVRLLVGQVAQRQVCLSVKVVSIHAPMLHTKLCNFSNWQLNKTLFF
jgi:hypothetical protein